MRNIHYQKITIIRVHKPSKKDINEELRWFCNSFGLFNIRDKDSSCYRVFIELLKSSKEKTPMSSDALAEKLGLSRGTIIHHMNKLIDAGIVIGRKNRYMLRVDNLEILVDEIEKDLDRAWHDIKDVAEKIDKELGL